MKLIHLEYCPICNSKDIYTFRRGTFNPQDLTSDNFKITDSNYGSLWNLSSCKSCTFVFSNPTISEESLFQFYSQLEDHEYGSEAEGRSKNFTTILKRIGKIKREYNVEGNSLLDIGAASGIFLKMAQQNGYDISGIEPSAYLVKEAQQQYGINLFKGTLDQFKSNKCFSIITLLDIIEHLIDPDAFFKQLESVIAPNGILVVVTPDIASVTSRMFGRRWWHNRIAHVNFFNFRSLQYLLHQHKYRIVLKKRYIWNFSSFYLLTRIFPFLKNKKALQKILKKVNLKLPLFDSWEIYANKEKN
jgi:2-polyprenyl-3-methyl-5-hydroxy-6-metoxy-1,4-benzoquinol methylase